MNVRLGHDRVSTINAFGAVADQSHGDLPWHACALELMKRFVQDASPAEILKMQAKLDVVREDRESGGGNQMVVVLGNSGPNGQQLEPPVIAAVEGQLVSGGPEDR